MWQNERSPDSNAFAYPEPLFGREVDPRQVEALVDYADIMRQKYFSMSPSAFDYLPLSKAFEVLLQINKVPELQGVMGQSGIGSIVYRLSGTTYAEDGGKAEIADFINSLLEGKSVSFNIQAILQLQTIAAQALSLSFGQELAHAIIAYLKTKASDDTFIIATLKERIVARLSSEEERPTLGVVTRSRNQQGALLFENLLTEDESEKSKNILARFVFTGKEDVQYVLKLSPKEYGLYNKNSNLVGIINASKVERPSQEEGVSEEKVPLGYEALDSDEVKEYLSDLRLKEEMFEVFTVLQDPYFRKKVEDTFGIDLPQVDLRVQVSVAKFLAESHPGDVQEFAHSVTGFRDQDLRQDAFTVLLSHENIRDVAPIFFYYSSVPEVSIPMYKKFSEMISSIDEVTQFLNETFSHSYEKRGVALIRENLIQKGCDILRKHSDAVKEVYETDDNYGILSDNLEENTEHESENNDPFDRQYRSAKRRVGELMREILTDIEHVNTDLLLLVSTFKTLIKGNPDVSIEDIKNCRLESYDSEQMRSPEMNRLLKDMYEVYTLNINNDEVRVKLLEKFKSRVEDTENNSEFKVLYFKEQLLAFIVFTKQVEGGYFASGLNVSPDMQGSGIGEVMMRETIKEKALVADVEGEVIATKDVVRRYLQDGAVLFEAFKQYGETGAKILWGTMNEEYATKHLSGSTDDELYLAAKELEDGETIILVGAESQTNIDFGLLSHDYVITRILKRSDGTISAVFEKKI